MHFCSLVGHKVTAKHVIRVRPRQITHQTSRTCFSSYESHRLAGKKIVDERTVMLLVHHLEHATLEHNYCSAFQCPFSTIIHPLVQGAKKDAKVQIRCMHQCQLGCVLSKTTSCEAFRHLWAFRVRTDYKVRLLHIISLPFGHPWFISGYKLVDPFNTLCMQPKREKQWWRIFHRKKIEMSFLCGIYITKETVESRFCFLPSIPSFNGIRRRNSSDIMNQTPQNVPGLFGV